MIKLFGLEAHQGQSVSGCLLISLYIYFENIWGSPNHMTRDNLPIHICHTHMTNTNSESSSTCVERTKVQHIYSTSCVFSTWHGEFPLRSTNIHIGTHTSQIIMIYIYIRTISRQNSRKYTKHYMGCVWRDFSRFSSLTHSLIPSIQNGCWLIAQILTHLTRR